MLFGGVLAAWTDRVRFLREAGADRCLIIAFGEGTGEPPSRDDADWILLGSGATNILEEFREPEQTLADPPPAVVAAIDAFDPEGRARVLLPQVTLAAPPPHFLGRRIYGRRKPESLQFEDKVRVDAFWDDLEIRRPPSEIVPVELEALRRASRRLDRGNGTIWAADASQGVHGGALRLRWIRRAGDLAPARDWLAAHCTHARVTPFLEGIPCSVHGLVFADFVAALRPVEMVTLRAPEGLRYCGAATFWDPSADDREYMRSLAHKVGVALRNRIGFRGAFTIDGVMSDEGFLPTELNSRFGAGLAVLGRSLPELPIALLCQVLLEGEDLDWRPRLLEQMLVHAADGRRGGGAWTAVRARLQATERHDLVRIQDGWHLGAGEETPDARLELGPRPLGGVVRFLPLPERRAPGPAVASEAVAALTLADDRFGLGIGSLAPARDVRSLVQPD